MIQPRRDLLDAAREARRAAVRYRRANPDYAARYATEIADLAAALDDLAAVLRRLLGAHLTTSADICGALDQLGVPRDAGPKECGLRLQLAGYSAAGSTIHAAARRRRTDQPEQR